MTTPAPNAFVTVAEIARLLRVSKMTVYRLIHAKEITSVQVGRSFRVHRKDLQAYLSKALQHATGESA